MSFEQRLRVSRGSAEDPLNLIQVMLAKGSQSFSFFSFPASPDTVDQRPNIMIATKDSFEPHSSEQLPASKKVFVAGTIHPDVRVPMREIEVSPTKSYTGAITPNAPVRVYDCSGPWATPISPAPPTKASPHSAAIGFSRAATSRNTTAAK